TRNKSMNSRTPSPQPLDYEPPWRRRHQRNWPSRVALILFAVCCGMLVIGILVEIFIGSALFEGYVGTFFGYGVIFGLVAEGLNRPKKLERLPLDHPAGIKRWRRKT